MARFSRTAKIRVNKLIAYMARLPKSAESHFDMQNWFRHDGVHSHKGLAGTVSRKTLSLCGTKACALGWAATLPYFKKLGLSMITGAAGTSYDTRIQFKNESARCADVFHLAGQAFDIDGKSARYLFRDIEARTPKEWASNAKRYMAGEGEA